MDIVIIGAGEVGYHLADILSHEDHRVSIIDPDPTKSRRMTEALDVMVVVGDGTRADVLTQAGTSKADLVIAVTDDDHTNMLSSVLAKSLGAKRIILRLKDTRPLDEYRYFYKQAIGFDVVLSTEDLAAEEIVNTVREQHALEVESFAGGRVQLRRFPIPADSPMTQKDIAGLDLPGRVLIVAVARSDRFFVPTGEDQLSADDQVYMIGSRPDLDLFEQYAGAPELRTRSVVLMGAGGVGRQIAHKLEGQSAVSIRIIELDAARARSVAAEHSTKVMVLEGDATDLDLLLEERIGEANMFVATSGHDEQNMVACQLAKSLGVERTVAMVNKSSYRQIYDLLGIDMAISPRILCANRILKFVRSGSVAAIAVLGEGRAQVLELEVHFDDGKGNRKVKSMGLPRGAVIGSLVRGDQVIIPDGETQVASGDHLIIFTLPENVEQVCSMFSRKRDVPITDS